MKQTLGLGLLSLATLVPISCSQSNEPRIESEGVANYVDEVSAISKQLSMLEAYDLKSDSLALVSIYEAMGGDRWFRNANWLSDNPLSTWQGVHTKEVNGEERVYALYIGGNNLRGKIPTTIKYLTALRVLHLKHNHYIDGMIPEGIYDLTALKTLDLSFTGLTGGLSAKVGQLTELDSLNLQTGPWDLRQSGNYLPNPRRLSGELPKELGKLTKARYISVYNQNFTGRIPADLSGLSTIEELSLQGCDFSGEIPASLGQLKRLKKLYLGYNQLSGAIPKELCQTTSLEELILSHNQLSGQLPRELKYWQRLNLLDLGNNQLSGELPEELCDMRDLFKIDLRNNKFTGELPARLGGEQQDFLRFVDIRGNDFTGKLPAKVPHTLRNLEPHGIYPYPKTFYTEYRLTGNRFSGELPEEYQDVNRNYILPQQEGFGFSNY